MPRPAVRERQRLPEDQRRLQCAVRVLLDSVVQGQAASRPQQAIVAEARSLVAAGAQELILIAQDTTDYGRDLGRPDLLPDLHAGYPRGHARPALAAADVRLSGPRLAAPDRRHGDRPRVCHYLDIPLQHGHPAILRRMFRPSNVDKLLETFAAMRAAMPDMAFRSTFIVGLPGETEEEFAGLLDFVQAIQFDKVGVFTFSPEPGTPAADMPGQVAEEVKGSATRGVMALSSAFPWCATRRRWVGRWMCWSKRTGKWKP